MLLLRCLLGDTGDASPETSSLFADVQISINHVMQKICTVLKIQVIVKKGQEGLVAIMAECVVVSWCR